MAMSKLSFCCAMQTPCRKKFDSLKYTLNKMEVGSSCRNRLGHCQSYRMQQHAAWNTSMVGCVMLSHDCHD